MSQRPNARCVDCGKRHRIDGPRCRHCRHENEIGLVDGHWVTNRRGIKQWQPAPVRLWVEPASEDDDEPTIDTGGDIVDIIASIVARHLDVSVNSIYARNLTREATKARHVACWVATQAGVTSVKIGRALGRDHSTVIHGRQRVDAEPELLAVAHAVLADYRERRWTEAA